jgi:hypothetical protein
MFMILAGLNHIRETLLGNLATYNTVTTIPDLLIPWYPRMAAVAPVPGRDG